MKDQFEMLEELYEAHANGELDSGIDEMLPPQTSQEWRLAKDAKRTQADIDVNTNVDDDDEEIPF